MLLIFIFMVMCISCDFLLNISRHVRTDFEPLSDIYLNRIYTYMSLIFSPFVEVTVQSSFHLLSCLAVTRKMRLPRLRSFITKRCIIFSIGLVSWLFRSCYHFLVDWLARVALFNIYIYCLPTFCQLTFPIHEFLSFQFF